MVILGIDHGYAIVGYGVIEAKNSRYRPLEHGAVTTKSTQDFNGRLEVIYNSMEAILQKWKPDAVAIEKLFFNSNQKTAIQVAEARGVILLAAQKAGVSISEYTPLQVKQAVTGYGQAQKPQVMEMTKRLLCLNQMPKLDDTCDALAMAICHGQAAGSMLRRTMLSGRM